MLEKRVDTPKEPAVIDMHVDRERLARERKTWVRLRRDWLQWAVAQVHML